MTNVELCKLWKSVIESNGSWTEVVSGYREATGSDAKEQSLKSSISTRLSGIRKELSSRGISDEKVADALPKLRRETNAQNYDDVIEFLIGAGQMKKETAE